MADGSPTPEGALPPPLSTETAANTTNTDPDASLTTPQSISRPYFHRLYQFKPLLMRFNIGAGATEGLNKVTTPTESPGQQTTGAVDPNLQSAVGDQNALGAANKLDEAARTFMSPTGLRSTPPTAEGLAKAQESIAATKQPPKTTQGS